MEANAREVTVIDTHDKVCVVSIFSDAVHLKRLIAIAGGRNP